MSWFKSCAVALLLVVSCVIVKGQTVDCSSPSNNTPYIIKIDSKTTISPTYCYSIGTIHFFADNLGAPAGRVDPSEWQFKLGSGQWQSGQTFNNVLPGIYNLTARNTVTGCVTSFVNNPIYFDYKYSGGEPTINNVAVTEASFCANDGQIIIDATTGVPGGANTDLRYRLNGGAWNTSNTFNNLAGGNYTIEVGTSDGRCISSQMATVPKLTAPTLNSVTTTASNSCSTPNGQIQINTTSTYDLMYSIDNGVTWSGDPIFPNLTPGTYQVAIAISGDERCVIRRTATVNGVSSINISSVTTTAATTCSAANGKITVNATGGSTLYYKIQGGQWQTQKKLPD